MEAVDKTICVFPYINLSKSLIMDDFEIHPYDNYDFTQELNDEEKKNLDLFVDSFRKTFFQKGVSPEKENGIGVLKYKGTIVRTEENSNDINEKIKVLYLLLKLHVNHDFSNPSMNQIDYKTFDIFSFNVKNDWTNKFGNLSKCDQVYTTTPEHTNGLRSVIIYPLYFCLNDIDSSLKIVGNFEDVVLGIDKEQIDITYLFEGINNDQNYYQQFLRLSSIHYGLEQQSDLFFYYAIIPSIVEVILELDSHDIKKQKAIDYGTKLDNNLIRQNEIIPTVTYIKKDGTPNIEDLGLIARTFVIIYDLRNELLHEGKRAFEKLQVEFKGHNLRIYDVFQLIFKFSILNELIEKGIIKNEFTKLHIEGNIFNDMPLRISQSIETLYMDIHLNNLIRKISNDEKYGI